MDKKIDYAGISSIDDIILVSLDSISSDGESKLLSGQRVERWDQSREIPRLNPGPCCEYELLTLFLAPTAPSSIMLKTSVKQDGQHFAGHKRVSINAPPRNEACFCFEEGLK